MYQERNLSESTPPLPPRTQFAVAGRKDFSVESQHKTKSHFVVYTELLNYILFMPLKIWIVIGDAHRQANQKSNKKWHQILHQLDIIG